MLVLTYLNPYFTGKLVLFYANYNGPWNVIELFVFVILGAMGGLYGAVFIKANLAWSKLRKTSRLGKHAVLEVVIVALITSAIGYINPFTRGGASKTIGRLFRQCEPSDVGDPLCAYSIEEDGSQHRGYIYGAAQGELWKAVWELALACVFKGIITIFTFGIKVPAGLFIPSMFVGACYGRIIGILTQQLVISNQDLQYFKDMCDATDGCVIPGLYAMVGAAGALGGVTRMTVSLVVIMFELTGGLTYIIPLMVAIVTSKWVGDAFGRDGIYDAHIHLNGYPFMDSKREFKHTTLAADVMKPKPRSREPPLQTVPATGATVGQIEHLLEETEYFGFPVVLTENSQLLAGFVYRTEISWAIAQARSVDQAITTDSIVYFTPTMRRHVHSLQHHAVNLSLWLDKVGNVVLPFPGRVVMCYNLTLHCALKKKKLFQVTIC
jgi:chloride channel 3/4/5